MKRRWRSPYQHLVVFRVSAFGTKRTFRDVCSLSAFGGRADISQRLLPLATSSEQILELRLVDRFCGLDGLKADPDRGLGARGSRVAWTVNRNASKVSLKRDGTAFVHFQTA